MKQTLDEYLDNETYSVYADGSFRAGQKVLLKKIPYGELRYYTSYCEQRDSVFAGQEIGEIVHVGEVGSQGDTSDVYVRFSESRDKFWQQAWEPTNSFWHNKKNVAVYQKKEVIPVIYFDEIQKKLIQRDLNYFYELIQNYTLNITGGK
jgi:hypothetical protein